MVFGSSRQGRHKFVDPTIPLNGANWDVDRL